MTFPHQIHPPTVNKAMAIPPSKPPTIAPMGTLEEFDAFVVDVGPVSINTVVVTTSKKSALLCGKSVANERGTKDEAANIISEPDCIVGVGVESRNDNGGGIKIVVIVVVVRLSPPILSFFLSEGEIERITMRC